MRLRSHPTVDRRGASQPAVTDRLTSHRRPLRAKPQVTGVIGVSDPYRVAGGRSARTPFQSAVYGPETRRTLTSSPPVVAEPSDGENIRGRMGFPDTFAWPVTFRERSSPGRTPAGAARIRRAKNLLAAPLRPELPPRTLAISLRYVLCLTLSTDVLPDLLEMLARRGLLVWELWSANPPPLTHATSLARWKQMAPIWPT